MKIKLFFLFVFLANTSNAQYIIGQVFDAETKRPLVGVHVYSKDKKSVGVTIGKGEFRLKIWSEVTEKNLISFSFVGYKTKSLLLFENEDTIHKIYLSRELKSLDEIIVNTQKKLNRLIKYNSLKPLPVGLYAFGSVLIDNEIYIIGGDSSIKEDGLRKAIDKNPNEEDLFKLLREAKSSYFGFEKFHSDLNIYNINLNSWTTPKSTFKKRAYHRINYNEVDNTIYVLGGKNLSKIKKTEYLDNQIELYNIKNDTITIDNTNPHQAVNFESIMYHNSLIVFGGSIKKFKNGRVKYTDKVHLYDITSGNWYELEHMISAKETNGVLVNEKIYIFGGFNTNALLEIESYDLVTGKWEAIGKLFNQLISPAITSHKDDIYIFENQKLLVFNTKSKEIKEYLIDLHLKASNMHFYNGNLYIIGGYIENEYSIKPSEGVYSINLYEFENTMISNFKKL